MRTSARLCKNYSIKQQFSQLSSDKMHEESAADFVQISVLSNPKDFIYSRNMIRKMKQASLTIEAAFVLPLFFLAMVTLIVFMDAVGMQVRGNLELSNRARRLAMDAAAASSAAGKNGISGVWIDLTETRTYTFPFSMIPVPGIALTERARVYPWIGYEQGSDDASDSDREDEMVYVTDYGSVYHTHADCTHLDLTIIATTTDEVGSLRNDYGEKYRKCDYFPDGYTGTVYVTAKGDRYYPSLKYAGITRHVRLIRKSEAGSVHECERCAARDAAGSAGAEGGTENDAA
jgi:hypothetical protein